MDRRVRAQDEYVSVDAGVKSILECYLAGSDRSKDVWTDVRIMVWSATLACLIDQGPTMTEAIPV